MKIIILSAGGLSGFSGVHNNLFRAIAKKHDIIRIIETKLVGFWKYYNVVVSFLKIPGMSKYIHPINTIFSDELTYNRQRTKHYIMKRSEKFKDVDTLDCDLIFQTTWLPAITKDSTKYRCMFIDFTMKLSEKEYPSWAKFSSEVDKKFWLEMEEKSYKNVNMIFTASDHTKNSLISDYGIEHNKIYNVCEGVNMNSLPAYNKKYVNRTILFVGIDFERKGGYILVEAFKHVKKVVPAARLVIVGSSPNINHKDIDIRGFITRNELLELYKEASIFVMPSICEPFGIVFLEAMANYMPCIGTKNDAMPEIIVDGETGFLVESENPVQLADNIVTLLGDEKLMGEMGAKGRELVENKFTWDLVVERMFKHIEHDRYN